MQHGLLAFVKILALILLTASPVGCAMASLSSHERGATLLFGTLLFTPFAGAGLALALPALLLLKRLGWLSTTMLFLVAMVAGSIIGTSLGLINIEAPPDAPRDFNENGALLGAAFGTGFGGWAAFAWIALFGKPECRRAAEPQAPGLVSPPSSG